MTPSPQLPGTTFLAPRRISPCHPDTKHFFWQLWPAGSGPRSRFDCIPCLPCSRHSRLLTATCTGCPVAQWRSAALLCPGLCPRRGLTVSVADPTLLVPWSDPLCCTHPRGLLFLCAWTVSSSGAGTAALICNLSPLHRIVPVVGAQGGQKTQIQDLGDWLHQPWLTDCCSGFPDLAVTAVTWMLVKYAHSWAPPEAHGAPPRW